MWIGRDGHLHTSNYDKRDDFNFHISNFPFLSSSIPSSPVYGFFNLNLYDTPGFPLRMARRLSIKVLKQGYLLERLKSSFRRFYGRNGDLIQQYKVSLSRMFNGIPTHQSFHQFHDIDTELDLHRITSGFHGAFQTGVACQQGTLTLPDIWYRPPFWYLLILQLLRPVLPNLPCLFATCHIEYPSVLSRFCILLCTSLFCFVSHDNNTRTRWNAKLKFHSVIYSFGTFAMRKNNEISYRFVICSFWLLSPSPQNDMSCMLDFRNVWLINR